MMISRASWSKIEHIDGDAVNRRIPPLVSLLLVILIGWQLAKIIWLLIPGPAAGQAVPIPTSMPQSSVATNTSGDVATIAGSHLFGIADAEEVEAVVAKEDDSNIPDTNQVLTLNGTIASDIPNYSVAIISDAGRDQEVFTIGDEVGNNATLHAVYPDRVVLNERGALTNLKLPREFKDAPATSVRRTTTAPRQVADNSKSLQAVVTQNLSKLTDVIRPTPYRVNGEQVGFRVYPGRDRRQFSALGLKPGDIIKDIDGQSLADATEAMRIFQSLGTAEQVSVTIERNGESVSLTLKTSQLDLGNEQTQ